MLCDSLHVVVRLMVLISSCLHTLFEPVEWYRRHPEEGTFLLEIAMGAIGGQMTNIDPSTGETSMMFHAVPHILSHDPHSGDYGLGLFGNALESGSYFVLDPALGALCFLCSLTTTNSNSTFAHRPCQRLSVQRRPAALS